MRRSVSRLVAASAATALVVAVCGSSIGSAATGSAAKAGPIKVLTFGDETGLGPTPSAYLLDGVDAAVAAANKAGGVQGRKIVLVNCNTEANPALAATCVEKAKSEGIVAAIPSLELLDNVTTPILEKEGIPILGINPSTATAQYSKTSACFINGPFILYPSASTVLGKEGAKSISMLAPGGVANENVLQDGAALAASAAKSSLKTLIQVPNNATDFSSIAASATTAGEDGAFLSALPPGLFSLVGDLAQTVPGIKLAAPGYIVVSDQVLDAFASVPATKGLFVTNYSAFPTDTSVPGIRLFRKEVAPYNKADEDNEGALFPWVDTWGAMQVLQSIKSGPVNAKTILAAMKTVTLNFEGVIPPWHYQYNALGLGCVSSNYVYDGVYNGGTKVTPLYGDKPVAGLDSAIIALYKKDFASYAK
jgi:branched-chain amino acid transport system substrate-binding protein